MDATRRGFIASLAALVALPGRVFAVWFAPRCAVEGWDGRCTMRAGHEGPWHLSESGGLWRPVRFKVKIDASQWRGVVYNSGLPDEEEAR